MQFNVQTCNKYKIMDFKKELLGIKGDSSKIYPEKDWKMEYLNPNDTTVV